MIKMYVYKHVDGEHINSFPNAIDVSKNKEILAGHSHENL